MKKAIFTLALVTCFTLGLSAQNLKLLTVDVAYVFDNYYKTQDANERLQARAQQAQQQLEALRAEGEALVEEVQGISEEAQNEALSDEARQEAMERRQAKLIEINEKQSEFQQLEQQTRRLLMQSQQNMRDVMLEEINIAIERVAMERDADMVLDASTTTPGGVAPVLYARESYSITEEVLEILNAGAPAADQ